jgi:soluble lytic murein transglycosylase-like protein
MRAALALAIALVAMLVPACVASAAAAGGESAATTTQSAEPPPPTETSTGTTTVPAPPGGAEPDLPPPAPAGTTPTTTGEAPLPPTAPRAVERSSQPRATPRHASEKAPRAAHTPAAKKQKSAAPAAPGGAGPGLTPPLPSTLGTPSTLGVPSFFINSFSIPPFLLPIYQAAGAAYGIPWQVLAAINEVETDYGRDLSVSSAGAEGWMQFMPATWQRYGVDVNRDGYQDPYNPADAIFAAARYLAAAGGARNIRAAIFAYNHSQAYAGSVLLRARLLGGTPPALLGAITALTEARFPVYAAAHYSDGFPTSEGAAPRTVPGTTIHTSGEAPVIAVQDARVVRIAHAGPLGQSITLRDAYGNGYTYAELGSLASVYPVLEAQGPQTAGGNGLAGPAPSAAAVGATSSFRSGSDRVYLHPLRVGSRVIAGTVLGHVAASADPHMVFQLRPAGAPAIDPKPILDGWVKLQSAAVIKARGRDPFARIAATPGQALLESKTQLDQQLPRDRGLRLAACERRLIEEGRVDRRVLATLAFLSASGLRPTVSARSCSQPSAGGEDLHGASPGIAAVVISAVNGSQVAGASGPSAIATVLVHELAQLQGVTRPLQIAGPTRFAGAAASVALPAYRRAIAVSFVPLGPPQARAAGFGAGLTPAQWVRLVARLGEVPDPNVSAQPSPVATHDAGVAAARAGGR